MEYSSYQLNIFDAIEHGSSNLAVNAVAGSGKTFTIVEACKRLGLSEKNVQFLAFNKSIADELKTKLAGYAMVNTSHSFGFGVIRAANPRVRVDVRKYATYIRENIYSLSHDINVDTPNNKVYAFCQNVLGIFNLCRLNLIQAGDTKSINDLCDNNNLLTFYDEISVVNQLLEGAYNPYQRAIDYTDMVVLPLYLKKYIPSFRFVFVDECQDLNTAQRLLMLEAARNGRFVAVGDRRQAINGFAGADCESFDKIANLPNTIELPLSVNYRCGKNMIKLAQDIVPNITAHEGAVEGIVEDTKTINKATFKPNDMVLCRTSAPLVGLCLKLIQAGVTACVKGKDIGEQIMSLVNKSNAKSIEEMNAYLDKELAKTIASIKKERKCDDNDAEHSSRYITLKDRCQCIRNICETLGSVSMVRETIAKIFNESNLKNPVMLSTIHKAKGLEADRVLILCPHKLPLTWKNQLDWQLEQELNLKYVALTRAKKELVFVQMDEEQLQKAEM